MFSLNESNRFYLYTRPVDLRKGFNMLCGVIRSQSQLNPIDGSVYIFINGQRNTLKLLHWERGGQVIYHKRLEQGRISQVVFSHEEQFHILRWDELVLLIEGINPKSKRRSRYNIMQVY